MNGLYLRPVFSDAQIEQVLSDVGATYSRLEPTDLHDRVAALLASEHVIGWFDGRMEFGPRALGARSILGDPRSPRMQACPHPDRLARDQPELLRSAQGLRAPAWCGVLVNTFFNVRGHPIVRTPADVYRCFMRTNIDYLVLGSFLLDKQAQPTRLESGPWKHEYTLD